VEASCTNDHDSPERIAISISEGIAVTTLKYLNSELGIPISQRDENDPERNN
jgi:hypothetical protein